jgi:hypothetical protein
MEGRAAFALGALLASCTRAFDSPTETIAQTPDGYLWLGTQLSLLRFDGIRKVPWQPPAGEHLPSTSIRRLLVSHDGRWVVAGIRPPSSSGLVHMKHIMEKLGANDRTQAMAIAARRGFIQL